MNREQKTKQEQTCPLVEFASLPEPSPLPATANKGHLGQLVHLAQLHSARACLWRVPSFQSINIVLARYSYYFCLTGTKNSIFNEFWVWALSSPYFHISSYEIGLLPFRLRWLLFRRIDPDFPTSTLAGKKEKTFILLKLLTETEQILTYEICTLRLGTFLWFVLARALSLPISNSNLCLPVGLPGSLLELATLSLIPS